MTTKDAGKKNTGTQGGISEQIKDWAKGNDWYRIDIQTNQLRLEQGFGQAIETIVKDLDYHNQHIMSRHVFDCYGRLSEKCRLIDMICRAGCRNKEEMLDLDILTLDTVTAATKLAGMLDLVQRNFVTTDFTDCTDRYKTKSQDIKSQNNITEKRKCHTPRLSTRLSEKEQQVWAAIHIQSKNIAQAAFEFKCTTQNVYKHLKNAERKMKVQGSRSANTRHNRLPEDDRGQIGI